MCTLHQSQRNWWSCCCCCCGCYVWYQSMDKSRTSVQAKCSRFLKSTSARQKSNMWIISCVSTLQQIGRYCELFLQTTICQQYHKTSLTSDRHFHLYLIHYSLLWSFVWDGKLLLLLLLLLCSLKHSSIIRFETLLLIISHNSDNLLSCFFLTFLDSVLNHPCNIASQVFGKLRCE